jgi:hypothetical protein
VYDAGGKDDCGHLVMNTETSLARLRGAIDGERPKNWTKQLTKRKVV